MYLPLSMTMIFGNLKFLITAIYDNGIYLFVIFRGLNTLLWILILLKTNFIYIYFFK